MILHVMPTYSCNINCRYCYLGNLRKEYKIINKIELNSALSKVDKLIADGILRENITHIDIYGGDIFEIPVSYLKCSIIKPLLDRYQEASVNIVGIGNDRTPFVTDLLMRDLIDEYGERVSWSISYNKERPNNKKTLQILSMLQYQPKDALVVLFPRNIKDSKEYLTELNALHVNYITFLQYFPSNKNPQYMALSYKEFNSMMIKLLHEYFSNRKDYNFKIDNINDLNDVINGNYNVYTDEAIFINPNGQLGFIDYKEFDGNIVEYFKSFDKLADIAVFLDQERKLYEQSCKDCIRYNRCYPEHLNKYALGDKKDDCCGRLSLINEYERLVDKYGINN